MVFRVSDTVEQEDEVAAAGDCWKNHSTKLFYSSFNGSEQLRNATGFLDYLRYCHRVSTVFLNNDVILF